MILDAQELLAKYPVPFTPHGIQIEDINNLLPYRRVGMFLPVGYGKTFIGTYVAAGWEDDIKLILVLPILIPQWVKWLNQVIGKGSAVAYEGTVSQRREILARTKATWFVMSYGIFRNDLQHLIKARGGRSSAVMVDECFPAGTHVTTPAGQSHIEDLAVGDEVCTSHGPRRILHVFNSLASELVDLELSNGQTIRCTPNHPVFTDLGWVAAGVCEGRRVLHHSALRDVRQGVQQADELASMGQGAGQRHGSDLFEILRWESKAPAARAGSDTASEQGVVRQGGQEQPYSAPQASVCGASGSGVPQAQGDGSSACNSGRQRLGNDGGREVPLALVGVAGLSVERSGPAGSDTRTPDLLQAGLRAPLEEDRNRSGRHQPSSLGPTSSGPQEGGQAAGTRVVRVSSVEQAGGTLVYNLEVEGCPHYFAEGVLVHNCQNVKNSASKLTKAVQLYSADQSLILATGTEMNKPIDAYSYIKLKTPNIYRSLGHFTNLHVAEWDFFNNPVSWTGLDTIHQNLYLNSAHRTKEEVHAHLPQPNYIPIYYDLHPDHKALYDKIADELIVETEKGGKIDGSTPQRLRNVLQQVVINWDVFSENPNNRAAFYDVLDNVMDEIDVQQHDSSKLIIWTWFKNTTRSLTTYLNEIGVPAVAAFSEVNSRKNVEQFMDNPEIRALPAQPGSAGAGLNPQHICWECIFAELPTVSIPFRQAAGRIDREGQKYRPNIRIAIANGTVQVQMYNDLLRNDKLVQKVQGNEFDLRKLVYG